MSARGGGGRRGGTAAPRQGVQREAEPAQHSSAASGGALREAGSGA